MRPETFYSLFPELKNRITAIIATKLGLSGIPEIAERILIERDLTLLEKAKCRYHISQLSSQKSLEVIKHRKEKIKFTTGVSINNLSLNENDIGDFKTFLKLSLFSFITL